MDDESHDWCCQRASHVTLKIEYIYFRYLIYILKHAQMTFYSKAQVFKI
jgi:hypothetical protein